MEWTRRDKETEVRWQLWDVDGDTTLLIIRRHSQALRICYQIDLIGVKFRFWPCGAPKSRYPGSLRNIPSRLFICAFVTL